MTLPVACTCCRCLSLSISFGHISLHSPHGTSGTHTCLIMCSFVPPTYARHLLHTAFIVVGEGRCVPNGLPYDGDGVYGCCIGGNIIPRGGVMYGDIN